MNCNAAVVSSSFLPSFLPSVLPSFTVPQQRRMMFLLLLVTTMLFPTENIVAAATGLEKERKWEAGSENLWHLDDTHTRTSERKRERKKSRQKRPKKSRLFPPSFTQCSSASWWDEYGYYCVQPGCSRLDQTFKRKNPTKPKEPQKTKNQPKKKKKKNHQLLSRHESNQACSTKPIPSSTKENKRGKKDNAVHETNKNKNKKRKQRSSRGARRGAPGVRGPVGGFKALC